MSQATKHKVCYAGLDVGLRSTHICVVDGLGKRMLEREVASDAAVIAAELGRLKVEYELY